MLLRLPFLGILLLNTFSSLLILTRLAYYFRIFEIVLIAEFVYLFSKRTRVVVLFVVYLYYIAMFVSALKNDIDAEDYGGPKMIPYRSVFD
ncbi:EpsG family protein [Pedobacter sp. NJ-S-72]